MAIAPIQHKSAEVGTSPNVLAYTSNITAGSVLTAAVYWNSNSATTSLSDSKNGAWTAAGTVQRGAGGLAAWSFQMYYFLVAASGATTVTGTASAGTPDMGMTIHEWGPWAGTPTANGTPGYTADSSSQTTVTTPGITTTIPTALIWSAIFCGSNATGMNAPFTNQNSPNDSLWGAGTYGYDIVSTTQSALTATFTTALNVNIYGIMAIGDAVASNPLPPPMTRYMQAVNRGATV